MAWFVEFWNRSARRHGLHTLNMAFMALNLRNPTSVKAKTSGHDRVMYPKWSEIEFEFPELDGRPALKMTWYDGGKMPPTKLIKDMPRSRGRNGEESVYSSGALVVGSDGMLFSPGDYGADEQQNTGIMRLNGSFEKQRRIKQPNLEIQQSPGHFDEYANAIQGEGTPVSNFADYAGPLTETILLGNLAVWANADEKIQWNAEKMVATGVPMELQESVENMIRHNYLNGYDIHELASAGK